MLVHALQTIETLPAFGEVARTYWQLLHVSRPPLNSREKFCELGKALFGNFRAHFPVHLYDSHSRAVYPSFSHFEQTTRLPVLKW